jgi:hypothetical protein
MNPTTCHLLQIASNAFKLHALRGTVCSFSNTMDCINAILLLMSGIEQTNLKTILKIKLRAEAYVSL